MISFWLFCPCFLRKLIFNQRVCLKIFVSIESVFFRHCVAFIESWEWQISCLVRTNFERDLWQSCRLKVIVKAMEGQLILKYYTTKVNGWRKGTLKQKDQRGWSRSITTFTANFPIFSYFACPFTKLVIVPDSRDVVTCHGISPLHCS